MAWIVEVLRDPVVGPLVTVFLGGLITWLAAWWYYKRAGDQLRAEAELLRKANMAIVYMLEHLGAAIEVRRDAAGNPIGLIVSAVGHAAGNATVKGVGGDASKDS